MKINLKTNKIMKQTTVEFLVEAIQTQFDEGFVFNPRKEPYIIRESIMNYE